MRKYDCTTYLIEDTVNEALKFNSLMAAANYLYDSDMSPDKPTKVSIYTALVYAVKHNNRYKNYTIRLERNNAKHSTPNEDGISYEYRTVYLHSEDITLVFQDLYLNGQQIQCTLTGFYYGEPDDKATEDFSVMPLTAQFF